MKLITSAIINNLSVAVAYDIIKTIRHEAEQRLFRSVKVTYEQAVYDAVNYLDYKEFGIMIYSNYYKLYDLPFKLIEEIDRLLAIEMGALFGSEIPLFNVPEFTFNGI